MLLDEMGLGLDQRKGVRGRGSKGSGSSSRLSRSIFGAALVDLLAKPPIMPTRLVLKPYRVSRQYSVHCFFCVCAEE